jgi:ubiquitin C-terminal hydrolase
VVRCSVCTTELRRTESFNVISLAFSDTAGGANAAGCGGGAENVEAMLGRYLDDEKLDGDNQYQCETCGKLTDSTRCVTVTRPHVVFACGGTPTRGDCLR